jgi:hypothetical protein
LPNISGVYITITKISKTFSISLSKNGKLSPRKKKEKKHCLQHEKVFKIFLLSYFESRQIWLNIFMDNHHFEQHNKIEKKKNIQLKKTFFFGGNFFINFH